MFLRSQISLAALFVICLRSKTWKIRVIMFVTLLVKFRNKDCKTTELGLLLQVFLVRIVTFVETLGSHLKTAWCLRLAMTYSHLRCFASTLIEFKFARKWTQVFITVWPPSGSLHTQIGKQTCADFGLCLARALCFALKTLRPKAGLFAANLCAMNQWER